MLIEIQCSLRAENNKATQVLFSIRSRDGRDLPVAVIRSDHFNWKRPTRSSAPAAWALQGCPRIEAHFKGFPKSLWNTDSLWPSSWKPLPVSDHPLLKKIFTVFILNLPWCSFEPFPHRPKSVSKLWYKLSKLFCKLTQKLVKIINLLPNFGNCQGHSVHSSKQHHKILTHPSP